MKKVPTLFVRDHKKDHQIIDVVKPECEWVTQGLGVPTYKWDGTATMHHSGVWYVRRTVKHVTTDMYHEYMLRASSKKYKSFPSAFRLEGFDSNTQQAVGWVPATGVDLEPFLVDALRNNGIDWNDGTYELIGPKINGNKHNLDRHRLMPHGQPIPEDVPTDWTGLYNFLKDFNYEGVVWWRVDGHRAKIKRRDFGLDW